jgi:hypothetical protein
VIRQEAAWINVSHKIYGRWGGGEGDTEKGGRGAYTEIEGDYITYCRNILWGTSKQLKV